MWHTKNIYKCRRKSQVSRVCYKRFYKCHESDDGRRVFDVKYMTTDAKSYASSGGIACNLFPVSPPNECIYGTTKYWAEWQKKIYPVTDQENTFVDLAYVIGGQRSCTA